MKDKKPTLKDEVVESAYKKCVKERGKEDVVCIGLYAQAKAKMIDTGEFLDRMDTHLKRGGRKPKRRKEHMSQEEDEI